MTTTRAARTAPPASTGRMGTTQQQQQQSRLERTRGGRPRTTGAGERGSYGVVSGEFYGDNSPPGARLTSPRSSTGVNEAAPIAAAPTATESAEEEPRYLAARMAGEMSARAYHHRNKKRSAGKGGGSLSSSALGDEEARAVAARRRGSSPSKGTGSGRQRRGGERQRRLGGGAEGAAGRCCSSSEISVSSCGDMTISSEEHEGEELAYAG